MRHWVWRAWHHKVAWAIAGLLVCCPPCFGSVVGYTGVESERHRTDGLVGWLSGWRAGKSWGKVEWSVAVM
jgi:hypothetical protein